MISNYNDLQIIFSSDLTIKTIAEKNSPCKEADLESFSQSTGFDTLLFITDDGQYMVYDNWREPRKHLLEHNDVVSDSTPLIEAFDLIIKSKRIFVKSGKNIDRIATLSDLNKIPFRIWMFGVISILELALREVIDKFIPDNWSNYLSPKRMASTRELFEEKKIRNVDINLIECLQLKDLATIVHKNNVLRSTLNIIMSNTKFEDTFDILNKVRDELAHSNKSFTIGWVNIFNSIKFAEDIIDKCETAANIGYSPAGSTV